MTKISVVIPVYNGASFIANAINSVLKQSFSVHEIIVINDGSKDNTAEELAKFGDSITVISIPNGGVSNARNTGIQKSTGDYVAFLDADDVWYEDKLEKQMELLTRYPEVGFSCCDFITYNKYIDAKVNHFSIFKEESDIVFDVPLAAPLDSLIIRNFVGTCSNVIIKKALLDKVGLFNKNYKQAEDYDLWLRCALVTKIIMSSAVLLEKNSHDANLTNNFLETLLFHEIVLTNIAHTPQYQPYIEKKMGFYKLAVSKLRYEIGNLYFENGQRVQAFKYFFKALFTSASLENLTLFLKFFGRKFVRVASFGIVRNKQNIKQNIKHSI